MAFTPVNQPWWDKKSKERKKNKAEEPIGNWDPVIYSQEIFEIWAGKIWRTTPIEEEIIVEDVPEAYSEPVLDFDFDKIRKIMEM